jgi:hypothetical protein
LNILITNIDYQKIRKTYEIKKLTINKEIYLNPWGFSRSGILLQAHEAIKDLTITPEDIFYVCLKNLFFGRRAQIIFDFLEDKFPNNKIIRIYLD